MSASSPSAFLRPTPICEHTRFQQQQSPRDRKEEKERKRKKPILSPVHLSPLEQPSHQTRADTNEIPQGRLYKLARSRKGPRAVGVEWSHRFKIPEPAPNYKIFACACVKDTRAHAHARGAKENQRFLSSSSTSVVAHRVSRVVHSSSLIIKESVVSVLCRSVLFFFCSRERDSRGGRGGEENKRRLRERREKKKKDLIISHLFFFYVKHAEPPREKEDKGKLEISLAHSPLFCISFF